MPSFSYTAIDPTGKKISGSMVMRNKADVYRDLELKALSPVLVKAESDPAAQPKKAGKKISGPIPLSKPLVILFTEELADLLDAGMNLEQALKILAERQQNPSIRAVSEGLRDDIREGARFSQALKKASPSFDELYRNLISAGEASGSLTDILRRLSGNLKQLYSLQRRTAGAMIYPSLVLLVCVVLLFVFSTVLMPQLTELIRKTGQSLPLITDLLIRFTDFIAAWWWMILISGTVLFLLFRAFIATKKGRFWWDGYKMKIPAFGPVIVGRFYAQFCHTLANLVNNGVPLLNGLRLLAKGTPNVFMQSHLNQVLLDVGEGASLARSMGKTEVFPPQLVDRVAIGEQTGELGKAFEKAARKYDEDLDVRIGRLTSVVPMVMLVAVASIVGVVAYSIITTIFGSMAGIRSRG